MEPSTKAFLTEGHMKACLIFIYLFFQKASALFSNVEKQDQRNIEIIWLQFWCHLRRGAQSSLINSIIRESCGTQLGNFKDKR